MNKHLFARLMLAGLLIAAAPGAGAQEQGEAIFARIRQRGELRVGMMPVPQFPYVYWKEGKPAGLEADLAAEIAKRLEVRLAVDSSFTSRRALRRALLDGSIDFAMSKYKRNLDDALSLRFSIPYSRLNYVLLVNRARFASLQAEGTPEEAFRGRPAVIGTLDDGIHRAYLAACFPKAYVAAYPSAGRLFDGLLRQACVAAFVDAAEARRLLAARPELGLWLQYVELPYISDSVCLATSWRGSFLAEWLDIFIRSKGEPATLDELFQTYGNEVSYGE